MFRFKLRTLLIATALICVFPGLQVHVHNKAKRSLSAFSPSTSESVPSFRIVYESTSVVSVSISDVLHFRRRCTIGFSSHHLYAPNVGGAYSVHYVVPLFGGSKTPKTFDDLLEILAKRYRQPVDANEILNLTAH